MKAVNKASGKIMQSLINEMNGEQHKRFKASPCFMDLVVEIVGSVNAGTLYSFAHYYEQNGDLMRDPDMVFLYIDADEYQAAVGYRRFYPISFRQDGGFPLDQESVFFKDGNIEKLRPKMQRDQATFAGQWMENIRQQRADRVPV